MNKLTLGSLFSGSGGFELAAKQSGITPIWNSEVEPFPILVTKKNLPEVEHLGDIQTIKGSKITPVVDYRGFQITGVRIWQFQIRQKKILTSLQEFLKRIERFMER